MIVFVFVLERVRRWNVLSTLICWQWPRLGVLVVGWWRPCCEARGVWAWQVSSSQFVLDRGSVSSECLALAVCVVVIVLLYYLVYVCAFMWRRDAASCCSRGGSRRSSLPRANALPAIQCKAIYRPGYNSFSLHHNLDDETYHF